MKKKNILIVTGGAGFVGSNLIQSLLKNTKRIIISIDNYSSGNKKNHIKNSRVKYLKGNTKDINLLISKYKSNIYLISFLISLSSIGVTASTLLSKLRLIQSALPIKTSEFPSLLNQKILECSKNLPIILVTVIFSLSPFF